MTDVLIPSTPEPTRPSISSLRSKYTLRVYPILMSRTSLTFPQSEFYGSSKRCVSTFLRQIVHGFNESTASSFSIGWLIHATFGRVGGVGILRTNRSGCLA